jgi:hypothetical protein
MSIDLCTRGRHPKFLEELLIMAIENNEIEVSKVESTHNHKFHQELQAEPMSDTRSEAASEKNNPEAMRIREMLAANELMIEQIKAHAFQVADRACESIERLPFHVQREFMTSISKFNEPTDLVYNRVRANYEKSQNA